MKYRILLLFCSSMIMLSSCRKKTGEAPCSNPGFFSQYNSRNFNMGFTTWPFGPDLEDRNVTYNFIASNADIYSEQIDNHIPWNALINNQPLPAEFTNDLASRMALKPQGHRLLLSVSLLNINRDNLLDDYDGSLPSYSAMNDPVIENAYYKLLTVLISQFRPDYLVLAMEVNELRIRVPSKWEEYKALVQAVKARLKQDHPALKMAESVTLHNWYQPDVTNPGPYIDEITAYVNSHDFIAISFYPFLKGQHTKPEFQQAFDFLQAHASKPIAFVETGHLAEDLSVPAFQLAIKASPCEQNAYLETLLTNAQERNFEFVIWWTHRDYDELWAIFPDHTKDIGKLWKDTGLMDEQNNGRPAYQTWKNVLGK